MLDIVKPRNHDRILFSLHCSLLHFTELQYCYKVFWVVVEEYLWEIGVVVEVLAWGQQANPVPLSGRVLPTSLLWFFHSVHWAMTEERLAHCPKFGEWFSWCKCPLFLLLPLLIWTLCFGDLFTSYENGPPLFHFITSCTLDEMFIPGIR